MNAHEPWTGAWRALTRRAFLRGTGGVLGAAALRALGAPDVAASSPPHHAPRARRVILLSQLGAPSQLDLFDPKPELVRRDGERMPDSLVAGQAVDQIAGRELIVAGSPFRFARHGESGLELSELLPNLGRVADRIAMVRSLCTDVINHTPAQTMMMTGHSQPGRPSLGAWTVYGLGSPNRDLPGFVVLTSGGDPGESPPARLFGNAFLPGRYQGVRFASEGDPVLFLSDPGGVDRSTRRQQLDTLAELNGLRREAVGDPAIDTRIAAYELAFRMQASVPELADLSGEDDATLALYGVERGVPSFAANCLLARRMAERGVRFVQLCHLGWDHHYQLPSRLRKKAAEVDRPCAALIEDLARRGLLDDTLVVFVGEFGRTPMNQGGQSGDRFGRDHHGKAFSGWLAGGGVRGGTVVGATDDFGYAPVADPVHVHDLNATVLHLLGIDHERLTFAHSGRDFRLTDVYGRVVEPLLA